MWIKILGIIAKQFRDLKYGDRFYFETPLVNSAFSFTANQLEAIRNVTMAKILCRNLDLKVVQKYAFFTANDYYNSLLSCADLTDLNLNPWIKDNAFCKKNYTVN